MSKNLRILTRMSRAHLYEPGLDFWLMAAVISGGQIVSMATNQQKRSGLVRRYFERYQNTHAEINAIRKARKKIDLTGAKLYVVRVRKDRSLAMAKPCSSCWNILSDHGIREVVYSVADGSFETTRI
jgi:tRNA(Arg) A34 adenosine deaminase TadA